MQSLNQINVFYLLSNMFKLLYKNLSKILNKLLLSHIPVPGIFKLERRTLLSFKNGLLNWERSTPLFKRNSFTTIFPRDPTKPYFLPNSDRFN